MQPASAPFDCALHRAPPNSKREVAASESVSSFRTSPEDAPTPTLIPDFARRKGSVGAFTMLDFRLSKELSQRVQRQTGNDKLDLFSALVAAIMLLLHRYAHPSYTKDRTSIAVGAPPLVDATPAADAACGVILQKEMLQHETVRDHIARVRRTVREIYGHSTESSNQHAENSPTLPLSSPRPFRGIFVAHEDTHGHDAAKSLNADMTLRFRRRGEYIEGALRYRSDELSARTARQFARYLCRVLRFMLHHPEEPILKVPLLTAGEYQGVLRIAHGPQRSYPTDQSLHSLVEEQVHLWSNQIAAEDRAGALTYLELNESANRIANLLIELGIEPGEFAAILHERGVSDLVFKLAALKAGAAFVPIDPSYPPDRVAFMLQHCEARFVLSSRDTLKHHAHAIEECEKTKFVVLSDRPRVGDSAIVPPSITCYDSDRTSLCSARDPDVGTSGRDLCYMIYTSGSTGRPKGAMIRHDGAINHIHAEVEVLQLLPQFSFLQSAPASSDISIWQYFGPLLTGGRTVIVDSETLVDAGSLFDIIKGKRLSLVELVPVVLRNLLDHAASLPGDQRALPDLKWIMVTGEAVPVDLINLWLSSYPSVRLVNAYGPSEASDDVTQMFFDRPLPPNQRSVPIGRPLPNCRIYIVDQSNRPAPLGVPGEICVAGICVGTGYWRNEAMTSAAFETDPFAPDTSQTMYRTGDLGRWLPDGTIEFLGRIDQQVAIRGFRVELEEVESVLREHPMVAEAAARIWEDDRGGTRLAAYVVPATEQQPAFAELRRFILKRLPDYMVPSVFAMIDKLPLAPSGKVDRRALPAPRAKDMPQARKILAAPVAGTELVLSRIWGEVLSVDEVGIDDNFFELGGDSILGIQVSNLARKAGIALHPSQVLRFPTIKRLADIVDSDAPQPPKKEAADAAHAPALTVAGDDDRQQCQADLAFPLSGLRSEAIEELHRRFGGVDDVYPLGPAQQGIYIQCLLARKPGAYVEQTSIDLRGAVDHSALLRAWQNVVGKYPALRTCFLRRGLPRPMQVVVSDVAAELRCHDWRHIAPKRQTEHWTRLLEEDRAMSFSLEKPPLHRLTLIRTASDFHRLLLTYHHSAIDGWSEPIILSELLQQYKDVCSGRQSEPTVDHTYHKYIAWLSRRDADDTADFWRQKLKGFTQPSQLVMERDWQRDSRKGFGWLTTRLDAEATHALRRFARSRHLTLNTVLQAAWVLTIGHYSQSLDVVYGTTVSGRQAPVDGIEAMVGMAVNTLPVRVQISLSSLLESLLQELQNELVDIQVFEHSMLAQVQSLSDVPRDRQPIIRSLFTLANYPDTTEFGNRLAAPKVENVQLITVPDFPLTCFAVPGRQLLLRFVYDRQRFEHGNITDMLLMYTKVLEAFPSNAHRTIAEFVSGIRHAGAHASLPQGLEFV